MTYYFEATCNFFGLFIRIFLFIFSIYMASPVSYAQCIGGDCLNGFGEKHYGDSGRFIGTFLNGSRNCGTYEYPNGNRYIGCFDRNQRSGYCNYTYSSGDVFRGSYLRDERIYGNYHFKNGTVYTGTFKGGNFDGMGSLRYPDGRIWEGIFDNGNRSWGGYLSMGGDDLVVDSGFSMSKPFMNEKGSKDVQPRFFAVVVGVADYDGSLSDLEYSDDDASVFYSYLKKAFPEEMSKGKSRLLLNKDATKENVLRALSDVFSQSTEDDYIVFYFSGHGAPGYFCPTDYTTQKLDHSVIKEAFRKAKAKYRLCIADACFSGSIGSAAQGNNNSTSSTELKDARIAVIMSSKPSQTSMETAALRQGLFSYYMIRGLRGVADLNKDSYVTMGELFLYVKRAVSEKSRYEQIPVIYGVNLNMIPMARISRQ